MANESSHFGGFGGVWTDKKLECVCMYFDAYCRALSKTRFKRYYIDAFAGGGRVVAKKCKPRSAKPAAPMELFESSTTEAVDQEASGEEENGDAHEFRHGSPLLALRAEPGFHEFIFIEREAENLQTLERQVSDLNLTRGRKVTYLDEDANAALQRIAQEKWSGRRAVVFLDPFALHLRWSTLEAIARTKAMDMWMLFPAMAVNRMLPRHGKIPQAWEKRLEEAFGDDSWKQEFYGTPRPSPDDFFPDLWQVTQEEKHNDPFERLSQYVTRRLKSIFADAVDTPLVLKNAGGSPLFLLCFAVGNTKGAPIAKKIAAHIIRKNSHGN